MISFEGEIGFASSFSTNADTNFDSRVEFFSTSLIPGLSSSSPRITWSPSDRRKYCVFQSSFQVLKKPTDHRESRGFA